MAAPFSRQMISIEGFADCLSLVSDIGRLRTVMRLHFEHPVTFISCSLFDIATAFKSKVVANFDLGHRAIIRGYRKSWEAWRLFLTRLCKFSVRGLYHRATMQIIFESVSSS